MVEKERQEEERKSKLAAQPQTTTTVGPNATVLKPRSAAQPKTGGVVLKTSTDKPTLVAKPAAPAPVRSPWASLPPVEKVPPVDINPLIQPSTSRPKQQENHTANASAPPPQTPAMEIAADDFTRTRKDNQTSNLGQLYNAQSGQYEPATTGRRGSVRKDQNFRPPSVLQRGSQHDQQGPAEPSAAFQTQRASSQQDHSLWTRRGSSTVSGESGPQGRRTSTSKGSDFSRVPNDLLEQRRESQPMVSPSTPGLKYEHQPQSALQSPAMQHSQTIQEVRSATSSPYQSRNPTTDGAQAPQRDEVAAMKALMKEKRELAIKRKKEEEEREEAAKKERIRLRMEKLGMAPLEEKTEKKDPEKKQIEKRVVEEPHLKSNEMESSKVSADALGAHAQVHVSPNLVSLSPPKAPVSDAPGASKQHVMTEVHVAPLIDALQATSAPLAVNKPKTQPSSQELSPPSLEPKVEATERLPSPFVNGITNSQKHPDALLYRAADFPNQNVGRDSRQQPWNISQRDQNAYGAWNGQMVAKEPSVSSSVWGPTSNSRTLGNGTFDRNVQRPQSRPQDQFASPALAPIGPPRNLQRSREEPELQTDEASQTPIVEDFQTIPTFPPSEASILPSSRPDLTVRPTSAGTQKSPSRAAATVNPSSQSNNLERHLRDTDQHQAVLNAWGSFKATEAERNRQLAQQNAIKLAEDAQNGIQRPAPQLPIMNETWRQVRVDDQNSQRHIVGVSRAQNTHDRPIGPQLHSDIRSPSIMGHTVIPPVITASVGRGSRFFPGVGASLQSQYQGQMRFPPGYRRSSSPPPPEDEFHYHPAYARDPVRPLVNLPFLKVSSTIEDTTPKVRLPPTIVTPVQSPRMSQIRSMQFRAASQPLVNNPSWQDRFNGLLGVRKTSPEKTFSHVADAFSATKVPLDLPSVRMSASVSLPPQACAPVSRVLEPASKHVEDEEALFENREFGSLPAVSIPSKAPEVGWIDAKAPKRGQSKHSRLSKEIEATSKDALVEKEMIVNGNILIFVKTVGMELSKSVPMPRLNALDAVHGASRPRNFPGNSKPNKTYKSYGKGSQGLLSNGTPSSGLPPQPRGHQGKTRPAWGSRTATTVH